MSFYLLFEVSGVHPAFMTITANRSQILYGQQSIQFAYFCEINSVQNLEHGTKWFYHVTGKDMSTQIVHISVVPFKITFTIYNVQWSFSFSFQYEENIIVPGQSRTTHKVVDLQIRVSAHEYKRISR
jgi:hypothetical protein